MYKPETILTLKNQKDPDPETGEEFPYNRVKVVGPSPVGGGPGTKWEGADAHGVIITPLSAFGSVLDEPFGKLRSLYEVTELPPPDEIVREVRIPVLQPEDLGPTPEQFFAEHAPGDPDAPRRPSHAISPLEEPEPAPGESDYSPLGKNEPSTPKVEEPAPSPLDE